jgi:hypothetical protein
MADIVLSPWLLGIDHVSDDTGLPHGAVRDAVNVDIDRNGTLASRAGYSIVQPEDRAHSLWTSGTEATYCVVDGELCWISYEGPMPTLDGGAIYTLALDEPLSYQDVNGDVVCANRAEILRVRDGAVVRLGVEDPSSVAVSEAAGVGGLDAGKYGVAISFLRGDEESALSGAVWCDVAAGNGLSVALPQPNEADVTGIRIYRTGANGDVLYRAVDAPLAISPYVVGAGPLGRQADTRFLARMPGGHIIRNWRGRLLVARGRNLLFSEPFRYGLFNPSENFVQFPHRIRMVQPVENGVFVGTQDGVVFLSGQTPGSWEQRKTGGEAPVAGTGMEIETSILGGDRDYGGAYAAAWLAGNGFVVGTSDGSLVQMQSKRIRLPDTSGAGAVVVFNRQLIATIN